MSSTRQIKSQRKAESRNMSLFREIRALVLSARKAVVRNVNTLQVMTNFEIGRRIVEHEQKGANRAEYGEALIRTLAEKLTKEFGKGFSRSNLEYMRKFYLIYSAKISQTVSGKLFQQKTQTVLAQSSTIQKSQTLSGQFNKLPFCSYGELARKGQVVARPEDLLKEPYVLEFLGLDEKSGYSESDLERAIIDKLEHFLLELGKGFLFAARQQRFTFDEDHFFVDLVFYNRLLRCYVLIDLKIGKLTHQDLGQMQMYVNYFDRHVKTMDENPTVGIILCRKNKEAMVEITFPRGANIHAKEYRLYLPSKEELRKKLLVWAKDAEGQG